MNHVAIGIASVGILFIGYGLLGVKRDEIANYWIGYGLGLVIATILMMVFT